MKKSTIILLAALAFLQSNAQKLPNVQQVSLRAPVNIQIDGKPKEWTQMQAYNPSTDIFYTIANDDKNLYLVVQNTKRGMLEKFVNGGVTFLVQKSGSKNDKGAAGIKFPYMPKNQLVAFGVSADHNEKAADAVEMNKRIAAKSKWIYNKGLPVKESVIPVYNDEGILAAGTLDANNVYTIEMAIDLNLLGLSAGINSTKFAYHILINGEPNKLTVNWGKMGYVSDGNPVDEARVKAVMQSIENHNSELSSTPDFWGEYTLAK